MDSLNDDTLIGNESEIVFKPYRKPEFSDLNNQLEFLISNLNKALTNTSFKPNPKLHMFIKDVLRLRAAIKTGLLKEVQDLPPKDLDAWLINWQTLATINRLTAIRVLARLPVPLFSSVPPDKINKFVNVQNFYIGIAEWLWNWETKIENPRLDTYPRNCLKGYALLIESRYKLIKGLFEYNKFDKDFFPNPDFVLLLYETATCRKAFKNTLSKAQFYEKTKELLGQFGDIRAKIHSYPIQDLEDLVCNFDSIINWLAREVAIDDVKFDVSYFSPYIQAWKHWNAIVRNNKNLQILILEDPPPPPRRGPQLGSEY